MMHLQMMKPVSDGASALAALIAAGFWLWSASISLPGLGTYWNQVPDHDPFMKAFKWSIFLSRLAAIAAGISAALQVASYLFGRFA